MVDYRLVKQQALAEVALQSDEYQAKFTQVNESKHALRLQLSDIERQLREMQREIAATNMENSMLKSVIAGEKELKEERNSEELEALNLVQDDLLVQSAMQEEDQRRVIRQREFAEASCQSLQTIAEDHQIKYQELLKSIENGQLRL